MSKPIQKVNCAQLLKVLADETRLSSMQQLMKQPMHVGELNDSMCIEQSLLSHHLKLLRESELFRAECDGKSVLYSLSGAWRPCSLG